jgi:adenylate cyclase
MDRRLAAILAADVVGFSRMMGEDEAGTLAMLQALRAEFIDPTIAEHRGRIVKLMGDGALVEFASVVDALLCAVAIQRGMAKRNTEVVEDRRIVFRIGINLGDIIVDGDDIYGNGVNVAARLEAMAEPGGVCLSGRVLDQVEKNVGVGFAFLGPQTVKNIDTPVNAYSVLLDPADAGKVVGAPKPHARQGRRWIALVALLAFVIAGGGALTWRHLSQPAMEVASEEKMAFPLPKKPSIAVLPFDNLSGDPDQAFLADGLTETIIGTLSQVPSLFVISRNSTSTYKGKPVPVKQVAEEQGVRYVLEGSIQRSGDRVRVTAQLIDALEGHHLWAEQYDRDYKDIFALQDDIAQNIMVALQVELAEGGELRGIHARAPSPEAYELLMKARYHNYRHNKEDNAIALELSRRAAEIAPDFPDAWAQMGWQYLADARFGWSGNRKKSFERAVEAAETAYNLNPSVAGTNGLLGFLEVERGDYDKAIAYGRKAVELAPGDAGILAELAWILAYAGEPEEAIHVIQQAMRLSPYYPPWFTATLGLAYMMKGDTENAIAAHEQLIERDSLLQFAYSRLAGLYAEWGKAEKAKEYAAELLKVMPNFSLSNWTKITRYRNPEDLERELSMLRKAGLPE